VGDEFSAAEFSIRFFDEKFLMLLLGYILFYGVRSQEGLADFSALGERVEALLQFGGDTKSQGACGAHGRGSQEEFNIKFGAGGERVGDLRKRLCHRVREMAAEVTEKRGTPDNVPLFFCRAGDYGWPARFGDPKNTG
jgi:hypothetical protein